MILKLNKIKIGDELVLSSDGVVGIGNRQVKDELKQYFPQFNEARRKPKIKMIGEGIKVNATKLKRDEFVRDDREHPVLNQFI